MSESGCNSVVEFLLPKQAVAGSNPVARSIYPLIAASLSTDAPPSLAAAVVRKARSESDRRKYRDAECVGEK